MGMSDVLRVLVVVHCFGKKIVSSESYLRAKPALKSSNRIPRGNYEKGI
jgi:hypothetical protein